MDSLNHFLSLDSTLRHAVVTCTLAVVALALYLLARRVLVAAAHKIVQRTRFGWDDAVAESGLFDRLALVAPALALAMGAELVEPWSWAIARTGSLLLLMAGIGVADKALTALTDVYQQRPVASRRPIKGPVQLVKIFLYMLGAVALLALLLGKSPWGLLSGIGAFTAVLMLVFRDTILSFVAGMQIVMGDLVRKGDWLEAPAFGADGDVIDIALYTVRVQNFDKTIVAIPTYKLMDGGFKNWRGMSEAGGRRIKRSLIIDQATVTFATPALLDSLRHVGLLREYLEAKAKDINAANAESGADTRAHQLNGRRMTNLGCFRAYVRAYLTAHPMIRGDMTLMVRQLSPSKEGLPLEIYCFTTTTDWVAYEAIQSDVFDHLLSALPWFGLKAYQRNLGPDARVPDELA